MTVTDTSPSAASSADGAGVPLPPGLDRLAHDEELTGAVLAGLARVEERLALSLQSADDLVDAAGRHLSEAGGKRVRPLLTLLSGVLGQGINDEVVEAAVVVEMTHLASLYHDDVMDSAPLRRGVPTAQEIWGNSVAILTGDLIFARASAQVSALGQEALLIQARTFERLVLGQMLETLGPRGKDPVEHYLEVLAGKTGSLIAACGHYGTLLGGAAPEVVQAMVAYGEKVGVAFQLADDVIDVTGTGEVSGKTPGTDLREGVDTLPVLLARQAAAEGDVSAARVLELVDGDLTSDADLAAAVQALAAHPVTEQSWQVAYRWADEAVAELAPLPESAVKEALRGFAQASVHRMV